MLRDVLLQVIAGVAIAIFLRQYVGLFVLVKGSSMRDTLKNGEILFAVRRTLHRELQRFDVVICRYPNRRERFVKRVVGLPGERIALQEGFLMINGEPVEEEFLRRPGGRNMTERVLSAGEYFVLGDNRPVSRDSRSVGPISDEDIQAVAKWILWPVSCIGKIS